MKQVIVITGASSGFGRLSANALAKAGHTVYASMREHHGPQRGRRSPMSEQYATDNKVDLRAIELDVGSQASADAAIAQIVAEQGRLDVVMHNAGHMSFGPAEAFTPEQLAELYDVNVLSTQRVNRAALPQLRKQGRGLLVWVSSSSSAGGTPPYLAPYFAAKAGMDALAVVYARELSRWGIETSIIVPGAFTGGTNHFAHSGSPADQARAAEYEAGPYAGFGEQIMKAFARDRAAGCRCCLGRRCHRRRRRCAVRQAAVPRSCRSDPGRRRSRLRRDRPRPQRDAAPCRIFRPAAPAGEWIKHGFRAKHALGLDPAGAVRVTKTRRDRSAGIASCDAAASVPVQPGQYRRVDLARIGVAEIVDLAIGDVGAGRGQ